MAEEIRGSQECKYTKQLELNPDGATRTDEEAIIAYEDEEDETGKTKSTLYMNRKKDSCTFRMEDWDKSKKLVGRLQCSNLEFQLHPWDRWQLSGLFYTRTFFAIAHSTVSARLVRGLLASLRGLLVRLLEAIAARAGVANKLAADRRRIDANLPRDVGLRVAALQERVNLAALFAGQMEIAFANSVMIDRADDD